MTILKKRTLCRLWEAATDLVNLNTWFSWQSSITPLDSLPLAVGKVSLLISDILPNEVQGVQGGLQPSGTFGTVFIVGQGH